MVTPKYDGLWDEFVTREALTQTAADQFKKYQELLVSWNEDINLTTITDPDKILLYHFQDSLQVADFVDFTTIKGLADVGTGAGFPGIPLKIKFPHLKVILIEVTHKKIEFLKTVIHELGLENIEVCPVDWRTFLRTTNYSIDLFVSRASLHTDELVRIFKPGCVYQNAQLIYWASKEWEPGPKEAPFIVDQKSYTIGHRSRRYIFFSKPKS